jgi:hypothetical protein
MTTTTACWEGREDISAFVVPGREIPRAPKSIEIDHPVICFNVFLLNSADRATGFSK